jgi:hypothetical protein
MSAQRPVAATFTAFTALGVAALAACTSFGYEPTPLPQSSASATASPSASATTAAPTCTKALESYRRFEMKELRIVLAINGVDEPQPLRGGDRLAGVLLVVARDLLADGLCELPGV